MTTHKIVVDSRTQTLNLFRGDSLIFQASISTSKFGLGFESGSFKTPTGSFTIHEKVGEGMPIGTVFKGRSPCPGPVESPSDADLIMSRILWLDGLESHNANTKDRYIYIHGTNQEHLIGQRASHGCVRMCNEDVVRLFNLVEVGTRVEIVG